MFNIHLQLYSKTLLLNQTNISYIILPRKSALKSIKTIEINHSKKNLTYSNIK